MEITILGLSFVTAILYFYREKYNWCSYGHWALRGVSKTLLLLMYGLLLLDFPINQMTIIQVILIWELSISLLDNVLSLRK